MRAKSRTRRRVRGGDQPLPRSLALPPGIKAAVAAMPSKNDAVVIAKGRQIVAQKIDELLPKSDGEEVDLRIDGDLYALRYIEEVWSAANARKDAKDSGSVSSKLVGVVGKLIKGATGNMNSGLLIDYLSDLVTDRVTTFPAGDLRRFKAKIDAVLPPTAVGARRKTRRRHRHRKSIRRH